MLTIERLRFITLLLFVQLFAIDAIAQQRLQIEIDGSKKLQRIDGIGVNVNTRSWNENELKPAINLLLDSMHFNIWRVIAETVDAWEVTNDNSDPFTFNWKYYDSLYETPKFRKAWDMIAYLNKRGVTDNLMINFMGFAPAWMGNKIIEPKYEDEYVEMIVSFFYYALKKKELKFGLIAPTNESDHHKFSEGPHLTGDQHARIIRKTIERMDKLGITGNIKVVAPDNADKQKSFNEFLPAMLKDSLVMSRIADLGFHSYGGNGEDIQPYIRATSYPSKPYWITEWNAWCNGCDDGILGDYNYQFARKSVHYLLSLLCTGANACLLWEGYDSYYSHHAPSKFSYWGVLGYDSVNGIYFPRKHFYAIQQVSKFLLPGSRQIAITKNVDSADVIAFADSAMRQLMITGINNGNAEIQLNAVLKNINVDGESILYYTDEKNNLKTEPISSNKNIEVTIPPDCIFTIVKKAKVNPEPKNWYAGDIHVHRNCGDNVVRTVEEVTKMMETNDLAVMSLLADMGNAEVKDSKIDLPKINGKDISPAPGKVMRWDAEWHWDATYAQFSNQALGGHLVLLGLNNAHQIWEESPYKVLDWAKKQNAVRGFAHFQYLNDSVQKELDCCIPIDYPVEAALGTIDFVSEDVFSTTLGGGGYNSEAAIHAYYKLLNCGFRLGFAAGTDYPCNNNEPPGSMLTYAKVDGQLTYAKWIDAIRKGRTVVSRNAHKEFLDLTINNRVPGDEIKSLAPLNVMIEAKWTSNIQAFGDVEIIYNGEVIASQPARVNDGLAFTFKTNRQISESGWICARRMGERGHYVHTAPVYIRINNKPVRASNKDAAFFVSWIDNILDKISPGGAWNRFFTKDIDAIKARYTKARDIYKKIAEESDRAPILVLTSQENFGDYTTEILKAEGVNAFTTSRLNKTYTLQELQKRKIVIVSSQKVSNEQAAIFTSYIKAGGNLISTMPVKQLQNVFGVSELTESESYHYITVNNKSSIGKGITTRPMRLHAKSSTYKLNGAQAVASFSPGSPSPAIVFNSSGKGRALSFLYNLPQTIVLTRQGNPEHAGKEMDSILGLRAMDLFTNGWVDTSCNTLNHADEQMRILSRVVRQMADMPMPEMWYFPDTLKCLVTLNNDGEDSKQDEFEPQFNDVYAKGAKMTLYIKEVDYVSKAWTDKWRRRGFEMSGHPDQTKHAVDPGWYRMDSIYSALNAKLKSALDIPPMETVTNHWFVWPGNYDNDQYDFVAQAKLEEKHGIGLDCNYAHYDNNAREKQFLGSYGYTQGNYTGSGLPMKFADADGNILNVYQQLNNVYDQQYMEHKDQAGYFNAFKGLMDRSIDKGVYSFISVRAHNNEYFFSKIPLMKMLDYANSKHIPVWTELQLLNFLKARDEAEFRNIQFQNNQLTFNFHSSYATDAKITAMIPYSFNGRNVQNITIDGNKGRFYLHDIKGMNYALLPVTAGVSHQIIVTYK
jgi:O-glycosyl hydrolase